MLPSCNLWFENVLKISKLEITSRKAIASFYNLFPIAGYHAVTCYYYVNNNLLMIDNSKRNKPNPTISCTVYMILVPLCVCYAELLVVVRTFPIQVLPSVS